MSILVHSHEFLQNPFLYTISHQFRNHFSTKVKKFDNELLMDADAFVFRTSFECEFDDENKIKKPKHFLSKFASLGNLKNLCMYFTDHDYLPSKLFFKKFVKILPTFVFLEHIDLDIPNVGSLSNIFTSRNFPYLKSIELDGGPGTNLRKNITITCKNLEEIRIRNLENDGPVVTIDITECWRKLQYLDLSYEYNIRLTSYDFSEFAVLTDVMLDQLYYDGIEHELLLPLVMDTLIIYDYHDNINILLPRKINNLLISHGADINIIKNDNKCVVLDDLHIHIPLTKLLVSNMDFSLVKKIDILMNNYEDNDLYLDDLFPNAEKLTIEFGDKIIKSLPSQAKNVILDGRTVDCSSYPDSIEEFKAYCRPFSAVQIFNIQKIFDIKNLKKVDLELDQSGMIIDLKNTNLNHCSLRGNMKTVTIVFGEILPRKFFLRSNYVKALIDFNSKPVNTSDFFIMADEINFKNYYHNPEYEFSSEKITIEVPDIKRKKIYDDIFNKIRATRYSDNLYKSLLKFTESNPFQTNQDI